MKTNLKDNIWIEGFETDYGLDGKLDWFVHSPNHESEDIIYSSKTSEIPEELAEECVEKLIGIGTKPMYKCYSGSKFEVRYSAKDSILSACPQEYCIIYKNNSDNVQ